MELSPKEQERLDSVKRRAGAEKQRRIVEDVLMSRSTRKGYQDDSDSRRYTATNTRLGILGSALLFVGVFTPIVSLPLKGSLTYFNNGHGDGVIILALALIAFIASLAKRFRILGYVGVLSLCVLGFTLFNLISKIHEWEQSVKQDLANNPFADVANALAHSVQVQWGWAILAIGAIAVITAAVLRT